MHDKILIVFFFTLISITNYGGFVLVTCVVGNISIKLENSNDVDSCVLVDIQIDRQDGQNHCVIGQKRGQLPVC